VFRAVQAGLFASRKPPLIGLGLLCVSMTSIVSIIFNQRLFALQAHKAAGEETSELPTREWTPSPTPFNPLPSPFRSAERKSQWIAGAPVELGRVEVEFVKD
jgi:hypothetical protein